MPLLLRGPLYFDQFDQLANCHGVPNESPMGWLLDSKMRFVCWNARGLLARHASTGVPKQRLVKGLLMHNDVVALEEVHGTMTDVRAVFHAFFNKFHVRLFPGPALGAGGLLIFVR
eukprot:1414629-Karenia_brevis.AAC.1